MKNKIFLIVTSLIMFTGLGLNAQSGKRLSRHEQGVINLNTFFEENAKTDNYFYIKGALSAAQWLDTALRILLNGAPLTAQNKEGYKIALADAVEAETLGYLNKKNYTGAQITKILPEIRQRVSTFMERQPLEP